MPGVGISKTHNLRVIKRPERPVLAGTRSLPIVIKYLSANISLGSVHNESWRFSGHEA